MTYTRAQAESDRSFLVGANYGRAQESARIYAFIKELRKSAYSEQIETLDELEAMMNG